MHDAMLGLKAMQPFSDPAAVSLYAENASRRVPGYADLHRMALVLLSERAPEGGDVLVLGAGGGAELELFANARPGWKLQGVDPSAPMLELAKRTLGENARRVSLHHGYIDDAPEGPFDGAVCLLTLHFLPKPERLRTLQQVRHRLKSKAPLVVAHHCFPATDPERDLWLSRFVAFGHSPDTDPDAALAAKTALATNLPALTPEEDAALLLQAGFSDVSLFYAAFTFRGWVAYNT